MLKLLLLGLLAILITMNYAEMQPEHTPKPIANFTTKLPTETSTKKTEDHTITKKTEDHPATQKTEDYTVTKKTDDHKATQTSSLTCNCTDGTDGTHCLDGHCTGAYCVTTAEENTLDGLSLHVNRTCQDNADFCSAAITITLSKDVYWRSNTTCCRNANYCNSQLLHAPRPRTTSSKLVCPSCFIANASSCTPTKMNCVGSENRCIHVTGTVKNGTKTMSFVGKGCATASASNIKEGTTLVFGNAIYHFTSMTITDFKDCASQTPGSVLFTFLLSSFVVLLQARLTY